MATLTILVVMTLLKRTTNMAVIGVFSNKEIYRVAKKNETGLLLSTLASEYRSFKDIPPEN